MMPLALTSQKQEGWLKSWYNSISCHSISESKMYIVHTWTKPTIINATENSQSVTFLKHCRILLHLETLLLAWFFEIWVVQVQWSWQYKQWLMSQNYHYNISASVTTFRHDFNLGISFLMSPTLILSLSVLLLMVWVSLWRCQVLL